MQKKLCSIALLSFLLLSMIPTFVEAQFTPHVYPYDEELDLNHETIGTRRPTQALPYGQWYTNINFDPHSSNYAKVGKQYPQKKIVYEATRTSGQPLAHVHIATYDKSHAIYGQFYKFRAEAQTGYVHFDKSKPYLDFSYNDPYFYYGESVDWSVYFEIFNNASYKRTYRILIEQIGAWANIYFNPTISYFIITYIDIPVNAGSTGACCWGIGSRRYNWVWRVSLICEGVIQDCYSWECEHIFNPDKSYKHSKFTSKRMKGYIGGLQLNSDYSASNFTYVDERATSTQLGNGNHKVTYEFWSNQNNTWAVTATCQYYNGSQLLDTRKIWDGTSCQSSYNSKKSGQPRTIETNFRIPYSLALLRSYSTTEFIPDQRGWSNSYFHQGRVPYSGGIYEGKFKFGIEGGQPPPQPVDGVWYSATTDEPTQKTFVTVRLKITKRNFNKPNAWASVLLYALFQYEWADGSRSLYDSAPKTNDLQSLHFDMFLTRTYKIAGVYGEDPIGKETPDWGDAYNYDLHVQRVVGTCSNVGEWYSIAFDWGYALNRAKAQMQVAFLQRGYVLPKYIILRWIGVSAEVIGAELEVQVDQVNFWA